MAVLTTKLGAGVTVCAEVVKPQARASAATVDSRRFGNRPRCWCAGEGFRVCRIWFTGAVELACSVQSLTSGCPAAPGARWKGAASESDALSPSCFDLAALFISV